MCYNRIALMSRSAVKKILASRVISVKRGGLWGRKETRGQEPFRPGKGSRVVLGRKGLGKSWSGGPKRA